MDLQMKSSRIEANYPAEDFVCWLCGGVVAKSLNCS